MVSSGAETTTGEVEVDMCLRSSATTIRQNQTQVSSVAMLFIAVHGLAGRKLER